MSEEHKGESRGRARFHTAMPPHRQQTGKGPPADAPAQAQSPSVGMLSVAPQCLQWTASGS